MSGVGALRRRAVSADAAVTDREIMHHLMQLWEGVSLYVHCSMTPITDEVPAIKFDHKLVTAPNCGKDYTKAVGNNPGQKPEFSRQKPGICMGQTRMQLIE